MIRKIVLNSATRPDHASGERHENSRRRPENQGGIWFAQALANIKALAALFILGTTLAGNASAAMIVNGSATGTLPSNSLGINFSLPANSSVYTTTGDGFNERNVRNDRQNTQTFQVGTAFTLDAVYLEYQSPPGSSYTDGDITLSIYNVADVNAATLTLGSLVVSGTFTSNATTRAAAGFTSSDSATSLLKFDFTGVDQVSLAASIGTAGYALQFTTTTGTNPVFTWQRGTGYAGGSSYETGSINTGLDYAMALTAVPEPASMALMLFGLFAVGRFRRFA